jgi:exopolyphosphatase / guanosine-5'-triphosphate,3'-diphosphate pyrophosphatase
VAVVDVGGGSSEIVLGTVAEGVSEVRSFKIGSGSLTEDHLENDPPSAAEIRHLRDHIADAFEGVEFEPPDQAVAVGGSATSLRTLVGAVLEYETLERAVRVLSSDEIAEVAKRFELDPRRVKLLPAGVLLLEKFSQLLGQPLQIGKGGLREGIILTLLNGKANGSPKELAA